MPSHSSLIGPMQPPVSGARPRASLDSADPGWRRTAQTMQTTAAPAPAPDAGGWTPLAGVEGRRGAGVWAGPKADAGGGESPRRASRRPSLRVPRRVGAPARNGDAAAGPASGSGDAALAAVGCAVEAGASARGSPEVPPQARSPEPSLRPPRSPSPSHRASGSVGKPPPEVLPGLRSNGGGRVASGRRELNDVLCALSLVCECVSHVICRMLMCHRPVVCVQAMGAGCVSGPPRRQTRATDRGKSLRMVGTHEGVRFRSFAHGESGNHLGFIVLSPWYRRKACTIRRPQGGHGT